MSGFQGLRAAGHWDRFFLSEARHALDGLGGLSRQLHDPSWHEGAAQREVAATSYPKGGFAVAQSLLGSEHLLAPLSCNRFRLSLL